MRDHLYENMNSIDTRTLERR